MQSPRALAVYDDRAGWDETLMSEQNASPRRHDLDWLRVGAFLLLILYHIGMFYVPWGWHVKSNHAPVTALELPMKLLNGWRLPLLFLISGIVLRIALDRACHAPFMRRRMLILWVPLLFGMYVICAPQAWFELRAKGIPLGGFWDFYKPYANWPWASPEAWPIITPTWNHLWYLIYIAVYSLVLICLSWASHRRFETRLSPLFAHPRALLLVPLVNLGLYLLLLQHVGKPQTLYGDWYNLTVSFLITTLGFLAAHQDRLWQALRAHRAMLALAALGLSLAVVIVHFLQAPRIVDEGLRILQGWSVIAALLAWGQVWLNRPSPTLRYLSGAVFTYYVVHQTIIIAVGVRLSGLHLALWLEAGLLIALTVLLCWASYHWVARHLGSFGLLLGARNARAPAHTPAHDISR